MCKANNIYPEIFLDSMPKPHSNNLRKRIIEEIQEGKYSKPEIAKRFRVSRSFIYKLTILRNTMNVLKS